MFFTYPAATTSLNVFGRRWCSKLYLRSAWVSSPNAAFRAASELPEPSATAGCSVAGAASVFSPWAGWLVETGFGCEVSGDLPQPVRRTAMSNGRTKREGMLELNQNFRKIQAARLPELFAGRISLLLRQRSAGSASHSEAMRIVVGFSRLKPTATFT